MRVRVGGEGEGRGGLRVRVGVGVGVVRERAGGGGLSPTLVRALFSRATTSDLLISGRAIGSSFEAMGGSIRTQLEMEPIRISRMLPCDRAHVIVIFIQERGGGGV